MNDVYTATILIEYGAGINAKDNQGKTPLQYANKHNANEIAKLLILHGAK